MTYWSPELWCPYLVYLISHFKYSTKRWTISFVHFQAYGVCKRMQSPHGAEPKGLCGVYSFPRANSHWSLCLCLSYQPRRTPGNEHISVSTIRLWKGRESTIFSKLLLGAVCLGNSGCLLGRMELDAWTAVSAQRGLGKILLGHLERPLSLQNKVKKGSYTKKQNLSPENLSHSFSPWRQCRA